MNPLAFSLVLALVGCDDSGADFNSIGASAQAERHGADDSPDTGDDNGSGGHGADDSPDTGDDNGSGGHGADDSPDTGDDSSDSGSDDSPDTGDDSRTWLRGGSGRGHHRGEDRPHLNDDHGLHGPLHQ